MLWKSPRLFPQFVHVLRRKEGAEVAVDDAWQGRVNELVKNSQSNHKLVMGKMDKLETQLTAMQEQLQSFFERQAPPSNRRKATTAQVSA